VIILVIIICDHYEDNEASRFGDHFAVWGLAELLISRIRYWLTKDTAGHVFIFSVCGAGTRTFVHSELVFARYKAFEGV
jgi:hypothetical protein